MADHAHVRSIDDIARFRSSLLNFLAGARAAVEDCSMDVARQQGWLDHDRRKLWESELWKRQRRLEEARQALFTESIASQRGPSSWHQMQVHRAERAVEEAREKLERVKRWGRSFENASLPMLKQVEQLHGVLAVDMAQAVAFLDRAIESLDAYSGRFQPSVPAGSTAAAEPAAAPPAPEPPADPAA